MKKITPKRKSSYRLPPRAEFLRSRFILWELNKTEEKIVNSLIDTIHHIVNNAMEREEKTKEKEGIS